MPGIHADGIYHQQIENLYARLTPLPTATDMPAAVCRMVTEDEALLSWFVGDRICSDCVPAIGANPLALRFRTPHAREGLRSAKSYTRVGFSHQRKGKETYLMEMNTQQSTTGEDLPRCQAGSKTDHPCWRPAVARAFDEDDAPTVCDEHARSIQLGLERDKWHTCLDKIEAWVNGPVREEESGHLERYALKMREEVRREYARASAKAYAAKLVAQQGPPTQETPLTREQSEWLVRLMNLADALAYARAFLEDLPNDDTQIDKWIMVDALAEAADTASEEVESYKRQLGLV